MGSDKDGKEGLAKTSSNAHAAEEKAANRQDKVEREAGERRAVDALREKRREADDARPQEAPAAARKAEAKQELQAGTPAPKPMAPPAPGAAPRAELAKKAAEPAADAKLKELQDESPLKGRLLEQAEGKGRGAPSYVVTGAKAVEARAQVEAIARKWGVAKSAAAKSPETAAPPAAKPTVASGGGAGFGRAVEPLVLEVTPAQLEELRAELAKAGLSFEAGSPEALTRGAAKDGLAAAPNEDLKKADAERDRAADSGLRKVSIYFVEKASK